ncbi:non-canonical purine NTP pyrophosphatase [Rhodococcus sp. BP-252]|uniref:non-canonical purine NTP pyrophosphatase n=1 Tax=unclassified Rhodococcus (in: high G+C Gram-positive bacteria) TaxID=192944 RepID=UPI001C9B681E|nr:MULTISPECIES: non-canonical purine NTP pyrophosphatase [unclassified Rhodococcus (in: high G+C Gram-positive bacteria)]MBY6414422.1 non-canonical purine NTP pyrophosphatase [Rhodococcus sp. BP-320]MBY6419139.1 non-canonical purine NTP pyrophosphatase [Rhodococcus sp. BP-321]MBY6423983.1 non-canonical purine NTP pyrophosphatase [Rhodococcus sp. BP-324]MBY6429306.1 non-canonical purine NTP pyrophosphatase [Rhodococcus sp. BP-323]MBY6434267.1 non-canonical purine NTP pyrophosphatase [Rhodococc
MSRTHERQQRTIRFLSRNPHKLAEAAEILEPAGVSVTKISQQVDELQTEQTVKLVRDKALRAFKIVGRELFVEHTGLYLDRMNGLPGGLTQIFWDSLEADRFSELFGGSAVIARTIIGYVDSSKMQIKLFEGEVSGTIAPNPDGDRSFQWDCIFIPDGYEHTFARLGPDIKNAISMRRKALDKFADYLKQG